MHHNRKGPKGKVKPMVAAQPVCVPAARCGKGQRVGRGLILGDLALTKLALQIP